MLGLDDIRLAILELVAHVHIWVQLHGLDHGVADDVGKGDLATAGALEVVIDHGTVFPHELDRHIAHGGSGRNFQGFFHVLSNGLEHALELALFAASCALDTDLSTLVSRTSCLRAVVVPSVFFAAGLDGFAASLAGALDLGAPFASK